MDGCERGQSILPFCYQMFPASPPPPNHHRRRRPPPVSLRTTRCSGHAGSIDIHTRLSRGNIPCAAHAAWAHIHAGVKFDIAGLCEAQDGHDGDGHGLFMGACGAKTRKTADERRKASTRGKGTTLCRFREAARCDNDWEPREADEGIVLIGAPALWWLIGRSRDEVASSAVSWAGVAQERPTHNAMPRALYQHRLHGCGLRLMPARRVWPLTGMRGAPASRRAAVRVS